MVASSRYLYSKWQQKKVDHVTSRLTPLPQQSHWRRGQEAPSPTLKVTTIRILNIFSLP